MSCGMKQNKKFKDSEIDYKTINKPFVNQQANSKAGVTTLVTFA